MAAVLMRGRGAPILITVCFAVLLAVAVVFHFDISAARDVLCDSVFRDAGQCAGERFLDPSPFAIWLPSDWFVWDSLRSKQLPIWEPLQGGGYSPLLTMYNGVFHPVRWMSVLFSRNTAPTAIIIVALYAGFLGTFLCAREIGASNGASLLAAVTFTCSGAVISYAEFSGCVLPVVHLPWILLFMKRGMRTRSSADFAAASAAVALMLISGHPSIVFCAIVAVAGIVLADAIAARSVAQFLLAATSGAVAMFLAAFALLPSLAARGELWSYKTQTYSGSSYGIFQWPEWRGVIYKAAVAHPYRYLDTDFWSYIGVPVIVLTLAGLYASFRATQHLGIMATLLGFLLIAFPGPWMAEIAAMEPVKYLKPWYVMGEVALFMALAAAIGFDQLRGASVRLQWLAAGFALWIVVVYGWRTARALDPIRWRDFPETAALAFLRKQERPFRITALWGQTHTPNSSRITGIEDVRTSQPILLTRYVTWWSIVDRDVRRRSFPTTRITDRLTHPLVAELGVVYVLQSRLATWLTFHTDPDPSKRDSELSPQLSAFPLALRTSSIEIRRNPTPIRPRAHFAERAIVVPDSQSAERALSADAMLPLRASVVESATPIDLPRVAAGSVAVRYTGGSSVVLDATSGTGGLVVLHDMYASGWRATVDGTEGRVLPVNILSRGVVVPPGRHRIEMVYMPRGLAAGAIISAAALAGLIAAVGWRRFA